MTTIEILQAACADNCDIEIGLYAGKYSITIDGPKEIAWDCDPCLETAVASAWHHYQTNKKQ